MSKITKAVLACGGWSTRFLPTTKSYAKQLLPVLSKPQILYALDECVSAGITEICIVHRDHETTLNQFFEKNTELDTYLSSNNKEIYMSEYNRIVGQITNLIFIPQTNDFPYGNGSPILAAKNFIGNDPFAYFYGDDFILEKETGNYLKNILKTFEISKAAAVCGVTIALPSEISKLSSVKYLKNNQMDSVVEKPLPENAPSNHAMIGRFAFEPYIIDILNKTATARGELWLTDAVNNLASDKSKVVLTEIDSPNSKWTTTGDPLNWIKVNILMALKDPEIGPKIKDFIKGI
ncbi:MAG: sugar phosphate nucleotidyltransferase [Candidatus Shapirobacteria bacterium]